MSRKIQEHTRTTSRSVPLSSKNKKATERIIQQLDNQLKNLSEHLLNKQPYLLFVPSDVPYRHSSRFIDNWYLGTPFSPEEEQLQYISFLSHQEEDEQLLSVVGGWADEKGELLPAEEEPSGSVQASGCNTPSDLQRKKISLDAYKTKGRRNKESDTTSEAVGYPAKEVHRLPTPALLPGSGSPKRQGAAKAQQPPEKRARPSPVISLATMSKPDVASQRLDVERVHMPLAGSETPRQKESPRKGMSPAGIGHGGTQATHASGDDRLPGLLSPTLPSPQSSQEEKKPLPPLVSPTLPPPIAKYLASPLNHSSHDGSSDPQRTDSVRNILASAGLEGGTRSRSDSQHSIRSTLSAGAGPLKLPSAAVKIGARTPATPGTPLQNGARASPRPRQKHIIALKYGKKNRKLVEGLLKFAPRTKKPEIKSAKTMEASTPPTGEPKNPSPNDRAKKRRLEQSPETVSKRPKSTPSTHHVHEKPSTPGPTPFRSPVPTVATALKTAVATPKRELKSSAMARVTSADGFEAHTPVPDRPRVSTPLSTERAAGGQRTSPLPTSAPNNSDQDRAAWNALNGKYFALGRTIKREATAIGSDAESSRAELAKSVVLLIEGLLCFMINLSAESYYRPNRDPGWNTILPYHIFVFRASRKFPNLHGVVTQLGAVCRQYIHKYDMDRLAKDPLPDDQMGSAPTPGSDGTTKTTEDLETYKKKYLQFRDQLVQNAKELQTAWLDGSRELSLDTLERDYPRTWKRRTRDSTRRGLVKPGPLNVPEEYYLPLDASSTAFEAARYSLMFLEEWTEMEGVAWKTRIDL